MGQKVNPRSLRTGITKNWPVRWLFASNFEVGKGSRVGGFSRSVYARLLEEDELVRNIVKERINQAGIASIHIERTVNELKILIKAARPGFVIGRGGKGIEELTAAIEKALEKLRGGNYKIHLSVNVEELKRSEISANYVAQQVAWDLEKRFPYRRTLKKYLGNVIQNKDIKGAKIMISGRLGGAEIARKETIRSGSLPLQTIRANVDYGTATAKTTYGAIGVKVWVYKGEFKKE